MSELFDRVASLFEAGHAEEPAKTWTDPRSYMMSEFRPAAVLMGITDRADPGFLMLHRPSNMRSHPGQVALPGGKIDPGESPVEAALREANEELGIRESDVRVIGTTDVYRTGSGFEITPVLGLVTANIEIKPNPAEVAQWFEAPVEFVLDPANQIRRPVEFQGRTHEIIEIIWQGHRIWGVTGGIIEKLTQRLNWHG